MAAETIHDLLPIPAGTEKPHAYQVLGLDPGEQDAAKIKAAIHRRIVALKAVRGDTDTAVWNRAARLVNQSRAILTDPSKKAQLDARFGILAAAGAATEATASDATATEAAASPAASDDPLAPWLPSGDPLAAWVPEPQPTPRAEPTDAPQRVSDAEAPFTPATEAPRETLAASPRETLAASADDEPAVGSDPAAPLDPTHAAAAAASPAAEPFPWVVDASPTAAPSLRRRKHSSRFVLSAVTAALVLLVGGLAYFLFWGPGGIQVRSGQGQLTLSTKARDRSDPDAQAGDRRGDDPVQPPRGESTGAKSSPSSGPARSGSRSEEGRPPSRGPSLATDLAASGIAFEAGDDSMPTPGPSADAAVASEPPLEQTMQPAAQAESPAGAQAAGENRGTERSNSDATMSPDAASSSEQLARRTAEADAAIRRASGQIRRAQWQQMKPAAERAAEVAMTETQKEWSESLYQLADLATHYRGGIERAIEQLQAGDQIELVSGLSVIVVEAGDGTLMIRRNARNYRYSLDELPFVVVDAVAPYTMAGDDPTTEAAKAAYQATAPLATEAHRRHATDSLRGITGEVQDADPERVAAAIERVFREQSQ